MPGRRPTPTKLKLIKGNPGKRALPKDEPTPDPVIPDKPEGLGEEASKEWDRIAPELERLGLLTQLDRAMLFSYCQAWGAVLELQAEIDETGWWVPTGDGGRKRNPAAASLNEAYRRLHSVAGEFGGTPAARVRLASPSDGKKIYDPLEELIERRRTR